MREYIQSHNCEYKGYIVLRVDTYRRLPKAKKCSVCKKKFTLRSRPVQRVYWSVQLNAEEWA